MMSLSGQLMASSMKRMSEAWVFPERTAPCAILIFAVELAINSFCLEDNMSLSSDDTELSRLIEIYRDLPDGASRMFVTHHDMYSALMAVQSAIEQYRQQYPSSHTSPLPDRPEEG